MADKTSIEWTDATWNAIRGCSRVTEGCRHCYAEGMAARFSDPGQWGHGLATRNPNRWTGKVTLDEKALAKPLRWRKGRRVFVTSIGDPFHESVPDEWLDRLFAVMALAQQHTFQLLTKRPQRMREYVSGASERVRNLLRETAQFMTSDDMAQTWGANSKIVQREAYRTYARFDLPGAWRWPLPNVWLGTSISNQADADLFIPEILATPAAVRFVSMEPLLEAVDMKRWLPAGRPAIRPNGTPFIAPHFYMMQCEKCGWVGSTELCPPDDEDVICPSCYGSVLAEELPALDWLIVGGESGPKARPVHPDWVRSLRDQCASADVPFLFKQWGEWAVTYDRDHDDPDWRRCPTARENNERYLNLAGGHGFHGERVVFVRKSSKKATGRLLDGVPHDGYPESGR